MKTCPIETSARHLHVSREDLNTLFGEGYELNYIKELSQPGQYACEERVAVVGPSGKFPAVKFPSVSILGPVRPETQVELSAADARALRLAAPIRESGQIAGSPGCKLVGPKGEVELSQGVIVAKRHIHMTTKDAENYGLADKQIVQVKYDNAERSIIYGDVVVRVNDSFALAMHIDVDEANAGAVAPGAVGEILA